MLAVFYYGKGVQCPLCEKELKKLLPYGHVKLRPNALCPYCFSLERHRLLWSYLKKKTKIFQIPMQMLHIAPELCLMRKLRQLPHLNYVTADLTSPLADIKMDLHAMPFQNESFDAILCYHVLEHVHDDQKCMQEILRVLKPNGWAILQVPICWSLEQTYEDASITSPKERQKAFGQNDHVRIYGQDYVARLRDAGFTVQVENYLQEIPPEDRKKFSLPIDEKIILCVKRT